MVAIGYAASGLCTDDVCYYEVSPDGELIREKWFKAPYYCMMHDFGITPDYLVLHIVPSIGSWERLEQMKPHFGFDTTLPVYLGIIPRRDDMKPEDIRWFKRDNCFASHVLNAWQEGTKIHFVTPEAKNNMFPFFPDVNDAAVQPDGSGQPADRLDGRPRQQRRRVRRGHPPDRDASASSRASTTASPGVKNRYGWGLEMDMRRPVETEVRSAGGMLMNCLFLKDFETGAEQHWWCGPTSTLAGAVLHPAQQGRARRRRLDRAGLQPARRRPDRRAARRPQLTSFANTMTLPTSNPSLRKDDARPALRRGTRTARKKAFAVCRSVD